MAKVRVGGPPTHRIEVVDYDETWPDRFAALEATVRDALGDRVVALSHVGPRRVPGLAAKPVIDADLTVADSADEAAYVPALEAAGFQLRIREPDWEEHRLLVPADLSIHLHVFSPEAREPRRHLMFRDWLRAHPEDREAYAEHKRGLVGFTDGMDYNNHKAALVYDLYEKAFAGDPAHPHDPQPR